MDEVIEDLLYSLDDPLLSLLQWDEVFSVVQVMLPNSATCVLLATPYAMSMLTIFVMYYVSIIVLVLLANN